MISVATLPKKSYTILNFRTHALQEGLRYDRSNKLWRCGNSSG